MFSESITDVFDLRMDNAETGMANVNLVDKKYNAEVMTEGIGSKVVASNECIPYICFPDWLVIAKDCCSSD
jgi:hypothetical protein